MHIDLHALWVGGVQRALDNTALQLVGQAFDAAGCGGWRSGCGLNDGCRKP
jgi:hypothetical protein